MINPLSINCSPISKNNIFPPKSFPPKNLHLILPSKLGDEFSIINLLHWIFPSINPFTWRLSPIVMMAKIGADSKGMVNPLHWNYFSATPYRLGHPKQAVKVPRPFSFFLSLFLSLARNSYLNFPPEASRQGTETLSLFLSLSFSFFLSFEILI